MGNDVLNQPKNLEKRLNIPSFAIGILSGGLIAALGIATGISLPINVGNKPKLIEYSSRSSYSSWISFKDNSAIGMKAFLEYEGHKIELEAFQKEPNKYIFGIPQNVFNETKSFTLYSIDREGNKSDTKEFYVADGIMLDKPFKQD